MDTRGKIKETWEMARAIRSQGISANTISNGYSYQQLPSDIPYCIAQITGLQNTEGVDTLPCYSFKIWRERDSVFLLSDTDTQAILEDVGLAKGDFSAIDPNASKSSFSSDLAPAYELSGNLNVPVDGTAFVQLWRAIGGRHYWFEYQGSSTPKTPPEFFRATITGRTAGTDGTVYPFASIPPNQGYGLSSASWTYSWTMEEPPNYGASPSNGDVNIGAIPQYPATGAIMDEPAFNTISTGIFGVGGINANTFFLRLPIEANPSITYSYKYTITFSGHTYSTATLTSINASTVAAAIAAALPTLDPVSGATIIMDLVDTSTAGVFFRLTGTHTFPSIAAVAVGGVTIEAGVVYNPLFETSCRSLPIGATVLVRKNFPSQQTTKAIVKTQTGNGTSTHTIFTVTFTNHWTTVANGGWLPIVDGVKAGAYTYSGGTGSTASNATAAQVLSALNSAFSPQTFTVAGSNGGPYTVTVTGDFADHSVDADITSLFDNDAYVCSADYIDLAKSGTSADEGDISGLPSIESNVPIVICRMGTNGEVTYERPGSIIFNSDEQIVEFRTAYLDQQTGPAAQLTNDLTHFRVTAYPLSGSFGYFQASEWPSGLPFAPLDAFHKLAVAVAALEARVAALDSGASGTLP